MGKLEHFSFPITTEQRVAVFKLFAIPTAAAGVEGGGRLVYGKNNDGY
jgi:hypothetical protein